MLSKLDVGAGSGLALAVSSGQSPFVQNSKVFSFDVAVVQRAIMQNIPSTSSTIFELTSKHVGMNEYSISVKIQKSTLMFTHWKSDSILKGKSTNGIGINLSVIVIFLLARGSAGEFFSYDAFSGSSVSPMNTPST